MARRGSDFDLRAAAADVTFTPGARDVGPLLDLAAVDEESADLAERALLRVGAKAGQAALDRCKEATAPVRGRLARIAGSIAAATGDVALAERILGLLDDAEPKTRRNAIVALGKIAYPESEARLIAHYEKEERIDHKRSIVASLGKIGGARSHALLAGIASEDPELSRITREALARLRRRVTADDRSMIDPERAPVGPREVNLHCRRGIEPILAEEIGGSIEGPGLVKVLLDGKLASLFRARTFLKLGFQIHESRFRGVEEVPAAVARALASPEARAVIDAFTVGAPRYRLEWLGGRKRASVQRAVEAIGAAWPELVNDPSQRGWEVVVRDVGAAIELELQPRVEDPRFFYRVGDVPAASHPTLAAALARIAGARGDDVVWDPFVGSGGELVERGLLGKFSRLLGSDLDVDALAVARKNLAVAKLEATLNRGDALALSPSGVTLVITNPPMGRRVHRRADLGDLLDRFVDHVARVLVPGGRFVWIAPSAERAATRARQGGLTLARQFTVDMGGFDATIQKFEKPLLRR
jgi:23S rRNA G2445 N2-methylase RlmL